MFVRRLQRSLRNYGRVARTSRGKYTRWGRIYPNCLEDKVVRISGDLIRIFGKCFLLKTLCAAYFTILSKRPNDPDENWTKRSYRNLFKIG